MDGYEALGAWLTHLGGSATLEPTADPTYPEYPTYDVTLERDGSSVTFRDYRNWTLGGRPAIDWAAGVLIHCAAFWPDPWGGDDEAGRQYDFLASEFDSETARKYAQYAEATISVCGTDEVIKYLSCFDPDQSSDDEPVDYDEMLAEMVAPAQANG